MQILSTKLAIPPLRSRLVERSRLIQKLNQGSECGFFLVSAPAGYGKTTLVSAWLIHLGHPAVWLTLDEGDNHPGRFLAYLAEALKQIDSSIGESLATSLQASNLPDADVLLTPLINNLSQVVHPFWLVLDDYHNIHNQEVHQVVSFLLEHRPACLHLVIATRADPPFALSRLRARSQMVELRLADLKFSRQEAEDFLKQVFGLNLSTEDISLLETSTEGWIAGLQMAGLSIQGRADASGYIKSFSGENRYILDFLFEEVFQRQTEDIQAFLLHTSILESLSASLCNAVTGREDSRAVLAALERRNLFLIPLDEQRSWYRYHHMFADLLRSRLNQFFPGDVVLIHQRASAWYEAAHDQENAIHHSLAALDFERAALLIENIAQHLDMQNNQPMFAQWVKSLPQAVIETHPWLCVYRAWGEYWTGSRGFEEAWLQMAEKYLLRAPAENLPERRHIEGHIAMVRAHLALVDENIPRALEMSQKALELLPENDGMRFEAAVALGASYWALGDVVRSEQAFGINRASTHGGVSTPAATGCLGYVGLQQAKQGRLQDAVTTYRHALRSATLPDGREVPMAGFSYIRLGDLMRERNELDLAAIYLERGLELCILFNQPDVLADAYGCLARYRLAGGDFAVAREYIGKADVITRRSKVDAWVLCWLDDVRIRLWLALGDLDEANRWVQNSGLSPEGPLSYQHDLHHQNLARVLVAQGCRENSQENSPENLNTAYEQASELLKRLQAAAQAAGWVHEEIRILLLQAVNDWTHQKSDSALKSLGRAVFLGEPGGYVRVFLDEGDIMQSMLAALEKNLREGKPGTGDASAQHFPREHRAAIQDYLTRLLSAFASTPASAAHPGPFSPTPGLDEPLSRRELEVLMLLSQGCTDKEIAADLVIARGTVHKHLKNIYGKLDVHNRSEAVARARQLGLL